jgi:LCP family protein required for cell wall assembly
MAPPPPPPARPAPPAYASAAAPPPPSYARAAAPAARPAPAAPPAVPKAKRRRRRPKVLRRVVALFLSLPVLIFLGGFCFAWYKFSQIPRAQVSAALSPASGPGTNYLIVGTDSREGISADDPNAGAFIADKVTGARTDSIMVMHVEGDKQSLLSVPRDLWVKDPASGEMGRVNATFEAGPTNLIKAVQAVGIPVHHYVEINFVSFGKLVDAVGGIDVDFEFPARDLNSGLNIETAGVNPLDGTQALAYVRSRHYEELKGAGAKWVTDPRSDLGRVERQRAFLTALMNKVTDTKNPVKLGNITDAMSVGLKIDDALNLLDALKLAWKLKGFHPTSGSLPVTPRTTSGGAEVLDLKQPDATNLLNQFNNGGLVEPADHSTTTTAPAQKTK